MSQMNRAEFQIVHHAKVLKYPKLFQLSPCDPLASERQLQDLEAKIGANLPRDFREFLRFYGGGIFGLASIFSADPDSDYYLADHQDYASQFLPEGCIVISEDNAGGCYFVRVQDGEISDSIWYWNLDREPARLKFSNIYEFVAENAYHAD